jgi:pilus assembly protein CpaE
MDTIISSILLVGSRDRQLEEILRSISTQVILTPASDLTHLATGAMKVPDVIVFDARGGAGVPASCATVRRQHPEVGIVIVAASLDPALLLEAMRAGVNEVVAEPFTDENVAEAVARVTANRGPVEHGKVFGFIGAKGGVGTTTVAVNVAITLGAMSKPGRTLLIDLHHGGGDAAVFAGIEPRFSVFNALENTHRLDQNLLRNLVSEVAPHTDLLAAPERSLGSGPMPDSIRRLLVFVATTYKYTIIDLPKSDGAVIDALEQLASIFVVANQELATVRSAGRLASMLRQRYGREKVTVLLSRSDRQADIGYEDVEKAVGSRVEHTFPSDYRAALQALNRGRPVALENHNDLSSSFRRFAHKLAGVKHERAPQKPVGLLGRLTHRRA